MKKPVSRPTVNAPHEVRIIGGLWKRTRLPVADRPGLRPTPARVRETLFNWLGQDLTGLRCLDAFAGTGALGLEAASRGAAEVVLVDSDTHLVKALEGIKTRLKADAVRVERGDGVAALLQRRGQALDVVFLDPPFADGANEALFSAALQAARQALGDDGLIYLEAPRIWSADELAQLGLQVHRQGKAGVVAFHLLRPLPPQ
ncbi:16S rRNA (guanine(966)-N(2))-methyltransferase RsmD [Hydrogenophaga sp.]|jgi:16S rRNA (guanine(966)-N(2))-methyltransferase RsmD|uniref:16S rRNA (guanine(966)-N(2))-methyltransferase RsmD n=1 Tax=Hydrogenophaga sp. TaxID=1904254 RepID=UPI0027289AA5|nr:16S rRNA (guanine(966)-N(2))-methyltransferase RsmD [Hydrogenophaga sp.]MDO9250998.1 16S rRNA (guanine(966)-N(2))-methyltransferase RsmD [Hydrogenophaga sp.]MDP2404895.1 16S rRNA (guanine(966)-N(2))-methyltransferase RsmD [Hydrogenophaga sp.]MDP3322703.1 16S rRNA (guanine(966)-N(2))-methyltransferase RsmD [Hydrogenophaga sp.]MDP3883406.1 16S rRNA (guanine(966)-N(2))-methyltransferase RsmD [Hydrogenophaga sp.]MDZ4176217.1 16S rRNA (guanine(966)-N(2))-methyltransferase RsmD [Hydrogenophaga sp